MALFKNAESTTAAEHDGADQSASTVRKQTETDAQLTTSFPSAWTPAPGMVLPTFRLSLLPLTKGTWTLCQASPEVCPLGNSLIELTGSK